MSFAALIIDDHPMFRDALTGVIKILHAGAMVTAASSAEEGLRLIREGAEPDLVLMDLRLPGMSGTAAIRVLKGANKALPIVIVSAADDPQEAQAAVQAGASGLVLKSTPASDMVAALRTILAGEVHVPAAWRPPHHHSAGEQPPTGAAPSVDDDGTGHLTLRQIEVLTLMAQGASNKAIAARLDLTEKTVKAHLTRVFKFLGVVNRTQAVLAAQRAGLVAKADALP
ncbi:MAG: response regulator transcription factor [Pseudomonadota bacterium]